MRHYSCVREYFLKLYVETALHIPGHLPTATYLNVFCQSLIYFHSAPNSWKFMVPFPSLSNMAENDVSAHKKYMVKQAVAHGGMKNLGEAFKPARVYNSQIIRRIVSALKGFHVPLDNACCNSLAEMLPLLSLSTLERIHITRWWRGHVVIRSRGDVKTTTLVITNGNTRT